MLSINNCVCFWQEADIAAGSLIVTDARRQYVDFTDPFLSMRWSALLRRPADEHDDISSRSAAAAGRSSSGVGNRRPSSGSRRVSTANQLLRSNIVCGVVENSVAHQMIATSADPIARSLYQRMTSLAASSSPYRGGSSSSGSASSDPFVRSVQEGATRYDCMVA